MSSDADRAARTITSEPGRKIAVRRRRRDLAIGIVPGRIGMGRGLPQGDRSAATPRSDAAAEDGGVYHRIESPTQTPDDAKRQAATGEVWGHPSTWSDIPKVKAYSGPLAAGRRGIEFRTVVPPDAGGAPGRPEWSGPRDGVVVEHGIAKLSCTVTRNTQT